MGIGAFFRTIFGHSEHEAELKRRAEEEVRKTRSGISSIEEAKAQLREAQQKVHRRAEEIKAAGQDPVGGSDGGREGTPVPGT